MFGVQPNPIEIIRRAPINVFSASGGGQSRRYDYPYKLAAVPNASQEVRDTCLDYIVDSGISDPSVTNAEVIETATTQHATYVIPKDYLHDQQRTTESIHDFLDQYEKSDCSAIPLIPLQPPHVDHYEELGGFSHYALGGIKEESPAEQVAAIERFREAAGPNVYVHALGVGGSLTFIRAVRENPRLVDSIDLSTHETAALNDRLPDKTWQQQSFQFPRGKDSTTVRAMFAHSTLIELNYMLSPLCDDEIVAEPEMQSALAW